MTTPAASKYDEQNSLALTNDMFEGVTFTGTGLTFEPKKVSYDSWMETGIRLGQMNRISGFALGDWLNYGQAYIKAALMPTVPNHKDYKSDEEYSAANAAYAESVKAANSKYAEAIQLTGLDEQTLKNMASVAARFQPAERIAVLTFTHHQEVAYVEDKKVRSKLLTEAAEKHLSVKELRAIRPPRSTAKKSPQKELMKKNERLLKNVEEALGFLKKIRNGNLLVEWHDVVYELQEYLPDIWTRVQEAREKQAAVEQAEKDANPY